MPHWLRHTHRRLVPNGPSVSSPAHHLPITVLFHELRHSSRPPISVLFPQPAPMLALSLPPPSLAAAAGRAAAAVRSGGAGAGGATATMRFVAYRCARRRRRGVACGGGGEWQSSRHSAGQRLCAVGGCQLLRTGFTRRSDPSVRADAAVRAADDAGGTGSCGARGGG